MMSLPYEGRIVDWKIDLRHVGRGSKVETDLSTFGDILHEILPVDVLNVDIN
jgi:hypothetical protein